MSDNFILDKLKGVQHRFDEVGDLLTQPDIMSDMKRYVQLNKEYKELAPVVKAYNELTILLSNIKDAKNTPPGILSNHCSFAGFGWDIGPDTIT